MGPPNSSYLSNTAIFHFHDYGRKSNLFSPKTPGSSVENNLNIRLRDDCLGPKRTPFVHWIVDRHFSMESWIPKKNTTNFQCFELINLAKLYMNSQTLAALAWSQGHFGTGSSHPQKTSTSIPGSGLWRAKASTNSTTWPFTAVATPWKSHLCETSTVSYLIHLSKKSF